MKFPFVMAIANSLQFFTKIYLRLLLSGEMLFLKRFMIFTGQQYIFILVSDKKDYPNRKRR